MADAISGQKENLAIDCKLVRTPEGKILIQFKDEELAEFAIDTFCMYRIANGFTCSDGYMNAIVTNL